MKSTLEKMDGLLRRLNIEVTAPKVQNAFESALKSIQKDATIKGFRKGKAPIATIRSIYGDRVKNDVLNDLVSEAYQQALDEHTLDPVGYPQINVESFDLEKALSFTAEFEVRPEVKINKFEGLQVEKEILEIGDERIGKIIDNIRESHAEFGPMLEDRGLQAGDFAEIDFEGFVEFKPLEGAKAEGHMLEIGAKRFIEGFEDGLIGMKPGQTRELDLKFPDDYHSADIRGKAVHFKVALKAIKRKSLPNMSDELAQKAGPFKSVDELKKAIEQDIQATEEKRIQEDLRNRLMKELVKHNPVQVPKTLMEQQKEVLVNDVKQKMQQQGMPEDEFQDYVKKWDADFTDTASFMVQSTFLVDALANQLKLRAEPKDIEPKIEQYAKQTGIELDKLREFYGKSERRSRLMFQITEERVVEYLINSAQIKEIKADKLNK